MKTLHCCERVNNFLWRQLLSHGELGVTAVPVVTPLYNLFAMRVHQKGFRYAVITVIGVIKSPKVVLCDNTFPLGDSTKVRQLLSHGNPTVTPVTVVTPLSNLFAMRVHQKVFRYGVTGVTGVTKSPKVVLCDNTFPLGDSTKVRHNYSMGRLAQSPASTAGGSITSRICQLATQQNFLQTPSRLPPAYLVGGKCGIAAKHPLPSKTPTRTLSRTRSS